MTKDEIERLVRGEHHEPHRLLGAHTEDGKVVVRAFRPDATEVVALIRNDGKDERVKLDQVHPTGLFEGTLDGATPPSAGSPPSCTRPWPRPCPRWPRASPTWAGSAPACSASSPR